MKRLAPLAILALVGCGGQNSNLNQPTGLYTNQARDDRERQDLVALASKELGKGTGLKATTAMNGFGFRLLRESKNANALISPFSISTALAMTLNGASGDTTKVIQSTLGFDKLTLRQVNEASESFRDLLGGADPKVELKVANAIWHQPSFTVDPTFAKATEEFYGAKLAPLDFTQEDATGTVNDWSRIATEGKIPVIVEKISPDVRLLLANSVYFKGDWTAPFKADDTKDSLFRITDKETVEVPFMTREEAGIASQDDTHIFHKPYEGGAYEMVGVMPKAPLNDFLKELDATQWQKLMTAKTQVAKISLPKWKAQFNLDLKDSLSNLGMSRAFDLGKADLTGLGKDASGNRVALSKITHATFLQVDEKGSEAAAVTVIEAVPAEAPVEVKHVKFDRPFIYAIRETSTGLVLFLGRMDNPKP